MIRGVNPPSPAPTLVPSPQEKDAELLPSSSQRQHNIVKETEQYTYIDWDDDDVHHPFNWSFRKRWLNVIVGLLFNAVTAMNATGYTAGKTQGSMELSTSPEIWMTGMTAVSGT